MTKKQSLCKYCVSKMARRIYGAFGMVTPLNALPCDDEDTCGWERTADIIIESLEKSKLKDLNDN